MKELEGKYSIIMILFCVGSILLFASDLKEGWISFLIFAFCFSMLFLMLFVIKDWLKNERIVLYWSILFTLPLYAVHFLVVPLNSKFLVIDGKLVDNWTWKVPFVSNVVEVDKNVFIDYACVAKTETSIIKGRFWTIGKIDILNKDKFLQFIANEKNPNKAIREKANQFLADLIKESDISKENNLLGVAEEEFHNH